MACKNRSYCLPQLPLYRMDSVRIVGKCLYEVLLVLHTLFLSIDFLFRRRLFGEKGTITFPVPYIVTVKGGMLQKTLQSKRPSTVTPVQALCFIFQVLHRSGTYLMTFLLRCFFVIRTGTLELH